MITTSLTLTITIPLDLAAQASTLLDAIAAVCIKLPTIQVDTQLTRVDDPLCPAAPVAPPSTATAAAASPSSRAKVVYRVIPSTGALPTGTVPERIRLFLLTHGPFTAREVGQHTGLGRKSVESALHVLRTRHLVEAVTLAALASQLPVSGVAPLDVVAPQEGWPQEIPAASTVGAGPAAAPFISISDSPSNHVGAVEG